jgi:hypothetical protein
MSSRLTGYWFSHCDATQPRDNQQADYSNAHVGTLPLQLRKNKSATLSKLMFSCIGHAGCGNMRQPT